MTRPTCPRRPTTSLDPEELATLVDHLLGLHVRPPVDATGPALVRARPTPEGVDLALRPLPAGHHPADLLLGRVVPPRWAAAGVVAQAMTRPDDGRGPGEEVTVAVLVGRDGTVAHRGRAPDGTDVLPDDDEPRGRLVDLLRCGLRLPTPPPGEPTRHLWEAVWLDAVVAGAATGHGPGLAPEVADALVAATAPGVHRDWGYLRWLACAPAGAAADATDAALVTVLADLVDRRDATWMDDGCFSRWVLGALPPPDDLLDAVDALLAPARAEVVRRALGRATTPPPDATCRGPRPPTVPDGAETPR